MKKIDTQKPLYNLRGEVYKVSVEDPTPFSLGRAMEMILDRDGGSLGLMKLLEVGRAFCKKDIVLLDKADFNAVKDMVEKSQQLTPAIRAAVLEALLDSPDDEEKGV